MGSNNQSVIYQTLQVICMLFIFLIKKEDKTNNRKQNFRQLAFHLVNKLSQANRIDTKVCGYVLYGCLEGFSLFSYKVYNIICPQIHGKYALSNIAWVSNVRFLIITYFLWNDCFKEKTPRSGWGTQRKYIILILKTEVYCYILLQMKVTTKKGLDFTIIVTLLRLTYVYSYFIL